MKSLNVTYTPHSRHKHSVRVTPTVTNETGNMKLPDLYITHDVLKVLALEPTAEFAIQVTFATK
jgi:hypothetical protein